MTDLEISLGITVGDLIKKLQQVKADTPINGLIYSKCGNPIFFDVLDVDIADNRVAYLNLVHIDAMGIKQPFNGVITK